MPVELRKRKAPAAPAPAPAAKKANSVKSAKSTASSVKDKVKAKVTKSTSTPKISVGDKITLAGFGGEVETNEETKTSLEKLVGESKSGVILFTYPKASTPGCTTQACLFRDDYTSLTASGFSIYGLSTDSPKANTTFKTKQNLPYTLLCDPNASLIGAIGFKKAPKGTTRGVFIVDKDGNVLAAEAGGPAPTVAVARKITEDKQKAKVASDVADTAQKLDAETARLFIESWGLLRLVTMASKEVVKIAKAATNAVSVTKKYTLQPTGVWEKIRRALAVDPERSSGVPLNAQFRNPPPGANPPEDYDDPTTLPAADIAGNPYWKRDSRRNYPRLSVVNQSDVVGLLAVGTKITPKQELIGESGAKQLVQVKQDGEEKGLAAQLKKDNGSMDDILGPDGLPPLPSSISNTPGVPQYEIGHENGFPEGYPCRTFV
ncbi:MAG: hypothetical protein M1814_001620 [Vezdaea aestivalis]|nr:MAG: hypothetical protein M1814_001620 [Vezdaea aestivalis]